ncbi:MAG: serpin family protein [Clostridia bacterium]|nr:serpin family protein [Clostridia bacterium]
MKNKLTINALALCILVLLVLAGSSCSTNKADITPEITPVPVPYVENITLNTFNDFAITLLKNIRSQQKYLYDNGESSSASGNVVISPINVGVALSMFNIGALGDTKSGIQEALELELGDPTLVTESAKTLMDALLQQQSASFADGYALYINEGPTLREDFAIRMEDYFKLDVNFLDFDYDRLETRLNDWASEVTSSSARITTIFPVDSLPHDTSTFVLSVNAVDCVWDTEFNIANTRTLPFASDGGQVLAVPTLRGKMTIGFYEDQDVTCGFLPLAGGKTTLAVFIPPEDDTIEKFLTDFTNENIQRWKLLSYQKEKWIYLPKINFSSPNILELSEVLSQMGADEMFSEQLADFSNLGNNFYVNDFYAASQIRITETGENPSDITAVDITRANNNGEDFFIVGRSFVFVLLDEETGGILAIGTLANPIEP